MRNVARLAVSASSVLLIVSAILGCGGSAVDPATKSGSCAYTETVASRSFDFCIESSGLTSDQVDAERKSCSNRGALAPDSGVVLVATYSDGACTRAAAVGSCSMSSGNFEETTWYYAGDAMLADTVKAACRNAGGTFTAQE